MKRTYNKTLTIMKRLMVLFLFALLLCDCSEIKNSEDNRDLVLKAVDTTYFVQKGATQQTIFVSPRRSISIGKEGGVVDPAILPAHIMVIAIVLWR